MINFFSIFKSQIPGIINRLQNVKTELDITQDNIKQLMSIEKILYKQKNQDIKLEKIVKRAVGCFGVALWLKDINSQFLYANDICCTTILKCTLQEALNLKNGDLKNDALSVVCMKSDQVIIKNQVTKRWIEHAVYKDSQHIFIDTVKSPVYDDNKLVGVVGNAVNITDVIPNIIKKQHTKSGLIEIALNESISKQRYIELLERRTKLRN